MSAALLFATSALAGLLGAGPGPAEDTSDLESLLGESVVSGASHGAEAAPTAPATTSTITAEELKRFGIRTLDEALDFLSLGMVTEHPTSAVEVNSRGVLLAHDYGSHVLLVIDGHAVNEPWDGTAYFDRNAALPLELIDHIEVILGPGSVLYGSNAMLGVVNVVTKRAKDAAGLHLVLESDLPSSLRGAVGGGASFDLLGTPAELTGQFDYYGYKGPQLTLGPQPYGEDSVTGEPKRWGESGPYGTWGGKVTEGSYAQIPSGYLRLVAGGLQFSARASMAKRASPGGWGNFDDAANYERDRWLSLDLRYRRAVSSLVQLSARGYFDYYIYDQNAPAAAAESCLAGQDDGCIYQLRGHSRWGGAELSAAFDWLPSGALVTNLGAGAQLRFVSSDEHYADPDGTEGEAYGAYEKLEGSAWVFLEQTARVSTWMSLNLGARYDYDQRFGGHLSPRAAVAFTPWEGGTLKLLYSEAFRAPTAFERYYSDPTAFIASPDLGAEVVRSVELSAEQRLGTQRLQVALFGSRWSGLVIEDLATDEELAAAQSRGELAEDVTEAYLYRNADSLRSLGGNLAVGGTLVQQRFSWGLGVTLAYTRRGYSDGSEAELPGAAAAFGNARVAFDFGAPWPTVALLGRAVSSRQVIDSEEAIVSRAPAAAEGRLAFSGPVPALRGLSYRLSGTVGSSDEAPYSIGPLHAPTAGYPEIELSPVRRWSVALALQYDL